MTNESPAPTPPPPPAPTKIVAKDELMPCGCRITEYADKSKQVSPCPPCGLMNAAQNMQGAAQALSGAASALAAVATRLRHEQNAAVSMEAARAMGVKL